MRFILLLVLASVLGAQSWQAKTPTGLSTLYPMSWHQLHAVNGMVYIFNSDNTSIYSNSVYKYNITANTLTKLGTSGTTSQTCIADTSSWPADRHPYKNNAVDTKRNVIWQFGGVCNGTRYYDLYSFSIATETWTRVATTSTPFTTPITYDLVEGAMIYDPDHDALIFHAYDNGASARTWHYCPTFDNPTPGTLTSAQALVCSAADDWRSVSAIDITGGSTAIGATKSPGFVWDTVAHRGIMFGGGNAGGTFVTQTLAWNPVAKTWTTLSPSTHPPSNTSTSWGSSPMAWDSVANIVRYHDPVGPAEWTYDSTSNTWTNTGNRGGESNCDSMTFDATTDSLVTWRTVGFAPPAVIQVGSFLPAPTITTTTLPGGAVGAAYSQTVSTTSSPSCSVSSGSVPTGLSLSSGCMLSGTPTVAGGFSFTVTASNGVSPDATQALTLNITGTGPGFSASGGFAK